MKPLAYAERCSDGLLRHGIHGLSQDGTEATEHALRYTRSNAAALDALPCGPHTVVGIGWVPLEQELA